MPPKSRISRQMILDSSIKVVRSKGIQNLNVRAVATDLKCSTQPIMYHFATMEELKAEIYDIITEEHFHTIMSIDLQSSKEPCVELCHNYIRYAVTEPNLFRFLYQTDRFTSDRLNGSWATPKLNEFLSAVAKQYGITMEQARKLFSVASLSAHGMACFLANNTATYNEEIADLLIRSVLTGCVSELTQG